MKLGVTMMVLSTIAALLGLGQASGQPGDGAIDAPMFLYEIPVNKIDGTETTLKIPSERLKIRTPVAVAADEELDFVYDIAPKKAGKSGKYILTPVISESGTEAEIEEVDARSDGGA